MRIWARIIIVKMKVEYLEYLASPPRLKTSNSLIIQSRASAKMGRKKKGKEKDRIKSGGK